MSEPLVCAIMLTKDRPQMAKRAVECFRSQTYQNKALVIWDTSHEMNPAKRVQVSEFRPDVQHYFYGQQTYTIGELRNNAIRYGALEVACTLDGGKRLEGRPDIIIHFDDDDWSHPNRISEQVALLQASGKQVVGYRDMLFWRTTGEVEFDRRFGDGGFGAVTETKDAIEIETGPLVECGEAWLYTNNDPRYALGSSLAYFRTTWERKPFPSMPKNNKATGEDTQWLRGLDSQGVSSLVDGEPRMICSIHGSNTMSYGHIEKSGNWSRVPLWDSKLRGTMAL